MTETVALGNKIVLGSPLYVLGNKLVKHLVIGIGKEHRLDVGVVYADMLHAVLLLIGTGKLVFLDVALEVILHVCANHQTILGLALHSLSVDVVLLLGVTLEPALVLKLTEVLGSLSIHTGIGLLGYGIKINLGLDDVIKGHLVTCCLGFGLL